MRSLKPEGRKTSLQNPYADLPAQASEEFDEGGELDIGMAFLYAGDEAFLGSDSIGQLLLSKAGAEPLFFELLSDNKGITFHLKLIPLLGSDLPEILGNEVFDGCQIHFLEVILFHLYDCFSAQNNSSSMLQLCLAAFSGSFVSSSGIR